MTNKQPVPILTAADARCIGVCDDHHGFAPCPKIAAIASGTAVVIDASELEALRKAQRLLYGFMLDTNAIGLTGAAENLARGIKEHAIAQEKAG